MTTITEMTFAEKSQRVRYLIATGYAESAQELAVGLATEGLEKMGREVCATTGHHYFCECESWY